MCCQIGRVRSDPCSEFCHFFGSDALVTQQLNSLVMTTAAPPPAECYMPSDAAALHHLVCDFMVDAVVVADQAGAIALTNPAFSRLFGFSADEVRGRTIDFLYAD